MKTATSIWDIIPIFNTLTVADKHVGDMCDGMDKNGAESIHCTLFSAREVEFRPFNGAWLLRVWNNACDLRDGVTPTTLASMASSDATPQFIAQEFARLITLADTDDDTDDEGRTRIGNTPTCEDCDQPIDHCTCEEN